MSARRSVLVALLGLAVASPLAVAGRAAPPIPVADPSIPAERDTEPVILTGAQFADWAAPQNLTVKLPLTDLPCPIPEIGTPEDCPHSHYEEPELDTADAAGAGVPVDALTGWRWNGQKYVQVPFQVDEMMARYLDNAASGFAFYSGQDQHTTYAYDKPGDREGFRFTKNPPNNPCLAIPDSPPMSDPVPGLDTNDEVVFMASDAGPTAPSNAVLPAGVEDVKTVEVHDPTRPGEAAKVLYVMRSGPGGPKPAFNGSNGYVRYQRDKNAGIFAFSESSYDNYGNAPKGPYCDDKGKLVLVKGKPDIQQRRPRDTAWITTDRYKFRYDGRWLMTQLHISKDKGRTYGPDLIDRWKARAFAQDPGSETPCCGYEDEDVNWGGSSILLGEHAGPVRTIRETWGADSGTNVIRREVFYRAEMRQRNFLRVHVIPPLDGIYSQWDHNAGVMTRFISPRQPDGVTVDGVNDELYGNFDDPCNPSWDKNGRSQIDEFYRTLYQAITPLCQPLPDPDETYYHQSIDLADLTAANPNVALDWNLITGPHGSIVSRFKTEPTDLTPGGAVQSIASLPYYRDDSCFDDGTGTDPGPHIAFRRDEGEHNGVDTRLTQKGKKPRICWQPKHGPTRSTDTFWQGSIGTYGVHIMFIAESDNARLTVPVTEVVSEQRQVYLPGQRDYLAGEQYGRALEKPLVAVVR